MDTILNSSFPVLQKITGLLDFQFSPTSSVFQTPIPPNSAQFAQLPTPPKWVSGR
ncbi:MAG: hypothetical protein NTY69_05260 [Methylococcales bacterium]|nr:hypothetical protein [Methylococcales bacterium]